MAGASCGRPTTNHYDAFNFSECRTFALKLAFADDGKRKADAVLTRCRMLTRGVGGRRRLLGRFVLGSTQVRMQTIEHIGREFRFPLVHRRFVPVTIQAHHRIREVLWESQPIAPFANKDVPDLTSRVHIENASACAPATVRKDEENFSLFSVVRPVKPSLRSVGLRARPLALVRSGRGS